MPFNPTKGVELLLETIREFFSPNQKHKSVIYKREDGLFQVDVFFWDDEWRTWLFESHGLSLTDTEANAEKIALENLRNCSGELF